MRVAIVTPVYKEFFTANERFSISSGYERLKSFDRIFISPQGVSYSDSIKPDRTLYFHKKYFKSVGGYNQLMLWRGFYESVAEYDYILIFQPDAFIFKDSLMEWCKKGYDYIGAPWPDGVKIHPYSFWNAWRIFRIFPYFNKPKKLYVGNGGLSLRKVSTALKILKDHGVVARHWAGNEDAFWSYYSAKVNGFNNYPDKLEAGKFSLELGAEELYEINNGILPFGCHGWEKHSKLFWRNIFKQLNLSLPMQNKAEK